MTSYQMHGSGVDLLGNGLVKKFNICGISKNEEKVDKKKHLN